MTSLTVCVFYALALFLAPILASIPGYATGPALILVGALLMVNTVTIPWEEIGEAVPAFLTIILMPLTYSIAYGALPLPPFPILTILVTRTSLPSLATTCHAHSQHTRNSHKLALTCDKMSRTILTQS